MKRMRSRHHRAGGSNASSRGNNGQTPLNRNHVFDSNGPDLRVRGTAQQLFEKYLQLGRDATGTGDRIQAEACFQYAEHYFRTLNAMNQAAQAAQQERVERQAERQRAYEQTRERRERRDQANPDEERPSVSYDERKYDERKETSGERHLELSGESSRVDVAPAGRGELRRAPRRREPRTAEATIEE